MAKAKKRKKKAAGKGKQHKWKLEVVYEPVTKLRAWRQNPRVGTDAAAEKLCGLMDTYGFVNPIIATPDGIIRAGHTRMLAAIKEGFETVPVIYVPFKSKQEAEMFAIADNKAGEWTDWNKEVLAELLKGDGAEDIERMSALSGFTPIEIDGLGKSLSASAGGSQELSFPVYTMTDIVDEARLHFKKVGLSEERLPLHYMMEMINFLALMPDENLLRTEVGVEIVSNFHPGRADLSVDDMLSLSDAFEDENKLQEALSNSYFVGGKPIGKEVSDVSRLLSKLDEVGERRIFRPGLALLIYRRFCSHGDTVLDLCPNFGGRLVGFIASGLGGTYVGVGGSARKGNLSIAKQLKVGLDISLPKTLGTRGDGYDFCFTSTDGMENPSALSDVMEVQYQTLKSGAYAVMAVNDSQLIERITKAGRQAGFRIAGDELLGGEKVFILRKQTQARSGPKARRKKRAGKAAQTSRSTRKGGSAPPEGEKGVSSRKKARKGLRSLCIACGGTGTSSKGGDCVPCDGKGVQK